MEYIVYSNQSHEVKGPASKDIWLTMFCLCSAVAETAEVILLKTLILQVICLYQKTVPHLVSQCKFDFSKLLKGDAFF